MQAAAGRRLSGVYTRILLLSVALAGLANAKEPVLSQTKPGKPWRTNLTETLRDAGPVAPVTNLTVYGGRADRRDKATGFFHTVQRDGRWWLVDPEGGLFLSIAMNSVSPLSTPGAKAALAERYGSTSNWADRVVGELRELGFNSTGNWSSDLVGRTGTNRIARCDQPPKGGLLAGFGKAVGVAKQGTGHFDFEDDCLPVFGPAFAAYCASNCAALAARKDDPWLIGWFSDNELPVPKIEGYLKLDATNAVAGPNRAEAEAWLKARGKTVKQLTDADRDAWAGHVFDRYLAVTTAAIRRHDPNHLCLGPRLHGRMKNSEACFRAAGRHLDVIAVNHYNIWQPGDETAQWTRWSGKPVMITEWYAKGADSGMGNTTGAGWSVPTQRDRGLFYQTYTIGLLRQRNCVGWHWFKYQDNDPDAKNVDPSNLDSNKGIVDNRYKPYEPLQSAMRDLNHAAYGLADGI